MREEGQPADPREDVGVDPGAMDAAVADMGTPEETPPVAGGGSCDCDATDGGGTAYWFALIGLLGLRRRRR